MDDARASVRAAIDDGITRGAGPRSTALNIVGRISRATGRREGGILGLTEGQAKAVLRAKDELRNLDPAYFQRVRRDKRLDGILRRAIKSGKPVSEADIDKLTGRYSDRLLAYRGEVIGRTETLAALQASQVEGVQQLIDAGKVSRSQVNKVWASTGDARTRDSHLAMSGQRVEWGQAFATPSGARMMHPHDTSLGAGPEEIIQCRCYMQVKIRYL